MARDIPQEMFEAIADLNSPEECKAFFAKLWNSSELRAMEQRVDLAVFMQQGSAYLDVLEQSGASSETVSRIRKAMLEHGSGGMMEEIIRREPEQE